jgi:uracil-DNA glycosylase
MPALYRDATQVVPGEGREDAGLILAGEQPGDKKDLAGKPFVGPAGLLLDRALGDAGIDRRRVFVTNAVKHFKYEWRGKRRLHKRPNAGEIDICRWWLDLERGVVRPRTIMALGATAARSLLARPATIARERGRPHQLAAGTALHVTTHPSLLLRLRDGAERAAEYGRFVADLRAAHA